MLDHQWDEGALHPGSPIGCSATANPEASPIRRDPGNRFICIRRGPGERGAVLPVLGAHVLGDSPIPGRESNRRFGSSTLLRSPCTLWFPPRLVAPAAGGACGPPRGCGRDGASRGRRNTEPGTGWPCSRASPYCCAPDPGGGGALRPSSPQGGGQPALGGPGPGPGAVPADPLAVGRREWSCAGRRRAQPLRLTEERSLRAEATRSRAAWRERRHS